MIEMLTLIAETTLLGALLVLLTAGVDRLMRVGAPPARHVRRRPHPADAMFVAELDWHFNTNTQRKGTPHT